MHTRVFVLVAIVFLFSSLVSAGRKGNMNPRQTDYSKLETMPGQVIVKFRDKLSGISASKSQFTGAARVDQVLQRYGVQSVAPIFSQSIKARKTGRIMDMSRYTVVHFSSPFDAAAVSADLSVLPEVEYAEPVLVRHLFDMPGYTPSDTSFTKQWNMTRVRADSAWLITKGDTSIVIGIVDTGVQWDHPDLAANIWTNYGEFGDAGGGQRKESNGIDDDGNGKIDDYHGWDFVGTNIPPNTIEDNNPGPGSNILGHGTHVAGIASAVTDNVAGVAGVGFNSRIMPIKAAAETDANPPSIWTLAAFEGIIYAAQMGADIINLSWGGIGASLFEQEMVDSATELGALIVAAAGNGNPTPQEIQYPASYRNVVSVAATQNSAADFKATYSSYNEFVDIAAPGGESLPVANSILSTYLNSGYAYISGTSMATPLVAGACALVKSQFPGDSPAQIGERIRAGSDDFYSANQTYRYLLGKGRMNVYRSLTISSPAVRIDDYVASDSIGGNNNDAFEPNEDIRITMRLMNYLQATSAGATATLTSSSGAVTVTSGSFPIGAVGTMQSVDNSASPFIIHVNSNIGAGQSVRFLLTITDGAYTDRHHFTILFNPTFASHNVNNVKVTLASNGRIGFNNLTTNPPSEGVGFMYDSNNHLFEGGFMMGYSATKIVNCTRSATGSDADFSGTQIFGLQTPGAISAQDGSTFFTDTPAPSTNRVGAKVTMHSFAFTGDQDDDYVIVQYDIQNQSGAQINGLYAGFFFDWDIISPGDVDPEPWNHNRTAFEPGRSLGYAWYDSVGSVYCGVRALDGAASYRTLFNDQSLDLSRAAKWSWLSGGVVQSSAEGDIHFVISSGPYNIPNGGTQVVAFALIGAKGLADLQTNSDAAQTKWNQIKSLTGVEGEQKLMPETFALRQNYPNPFNPSTVIPFELPERSVVSLRVYDVLGRQVGTLINHESYAAGFHEVNWDAGTLPGGVYFCRLETGSFAATRKLLLVK